MAQALRDAETLGLDCVQVFTKNQQQWVAKPLEDSAIGEWATEMKRLKWSGGNVVSHASYLANMASPDNELRDKSIALMRIELDRCEQLGIGLLVFHPGAFTTSSLEGGTARIAAACIQLLKDTAGYKTVLCLENVAGQGSTIGRTFEELADLRKRIANSAGPDRIGFCIDTAHAHAAGYNLADRAGAERILDEMMAKLGRDSVRCMHINDSKTPAGSRVDRHAHIGEGTIGLAGFAAVVNHPVLSKLPKIMETPKEDAKEKGKSGGPAWDSINVGRLRGLIGVKDRSFAGVKPIGGAVPPAPKPAKAPAKKAAKPPKPLAAGKSKSLKPTARKGKP